MQLKTPSVQWCIGSLSCAFGRGGRLSLRHSRVSHFQYRSGQGSIGGRYLRKEEHFFCLASKLEHFEQQGPVRFVAHYVTIGILTLSSLLEGFESLLPSQNRHRRHRQGPTFSTLDSIAGSKAISRVERKLGRIAVGQKAGN